jgi:uncharacterized membrane protein
MATKTLVKTFDDAGEAERAVHALHEAGFARDDLGWIARSRSTRSRHPLETANAAMEGAAVGGALGGLAGLLIGFAALTVPGIGPIVVAGPLVSTLAGVGLGAAAGGIIDALMHIGVSREEAQEHAARLRSGGAIVTVTVDDDDEEDRAREILHEARVQRPSIRWRAQPFTDEGRPSLQSLV